MKVCKVSWCDKEAHSYDLCWGHSSNFRKTGEACPPTLAWLVGTRTLLAKSCTHCGVLQPASEFKQRKHDKNGNLYHNAWCRTCVRVDNRERARRLGYYNDAYRAAHEKYMANMQAETRAGAHHHYQEYTLADWDVILNTDLTIKQRAEILGRTFKAVANMVHKHKKGLAGPRNKEEA